MSLMRVATLNRAQALQNPPRGSCMVQLRSPSIVSRFTAANLSHNDANNNLEVQELI